MEFAIILACTVVACFALRNPIKACPVAFYALAVIVDVVFMAHGIVELPRPMWLALFTLIQKCTLSLAMFIVVMYIGCFSKDSKLTLWLRPIRAELSIIAWLLSLGHMAVYLASYLPRIMGGGPFSLNIMSAFVLALVLFVLLIILGVTSFNFVKKKMDPHGWKKIQKLAYPFFMLTYAHLLLMLLPSALRGGQAAAVTVGVYSVVFIGYAVLRIRRAMIDKGHEEAKPAVA